MDVNFVRVLLIFFSLFMGLVGSLVNFADAYIPTFITRGFRYGKFAAKTECQSVERTEVPKRWFAHFYVLCTPISTYLLYTMYSKCFYNESVSDLVYWTLDLLLGESRKPSVSLESTLLAQLLFTIHAYKRLYESYCVSVYSDSKMNITHYIVGLVHYCCVNLAIVGESDGFVRGSRGICYLRRWSLVQLIAAAVLLWATFSQLKANRVLRSLRINKDGAVVTEGYKIPHGGLFDYVTGALQITEILVYASLSVIIWDSITFRYVALWVLLNQVECALLSHWWYQDTFKNYPKTRKILIPYLF